MVVIQVFKKVIPSQTTGKYNMTVKALPMKKDAALGWPFKSCSVHCTTIRKTHKQFSI